MCHGPVRLLQLPMEINPVTFLLGQKIGKRPRRVGSGHAGELEVLGEALLEGEALKLTRLLFQLPCIEGFVARQELFDGGTRDLSGPRGFLVVHVGSIA